MDYLKPKLNNFTLQYLQKQTAEWLEQKCKCYIQCKLRGTLKVFHNENVVYDKLFLTVQRP